MITKYHAKYYGLLLTQRSLGENLNTLSQSLLSASVDINPHQKSTAFEQLQSDMQLEIDSRLEDREEEISERRKELIKALENKMIQSSSTDSILSSIGQHQYNQYERIW